MSTIIGGTGYGGYASYGAAMPTYGAASYGTAMPTYGASYGATPTYGGYGGYGAHAPMDAATVNRAVSSNGGVFLCMCVCVCVCVFSINSLSVYVCLPPVRMCAHVCVSVSGVCAPTWPGASFLGYPFFRPGI